MGRASSAVGSHPTSHGLPGPGWSLVYRIYSRLSHFVGLGRDGGGGGIDLKHFPRPSQHGMLALSLTRT